MESTEKDNNSKLVQMRLQKKTLDRIENLKKVTGTENKTQLVAASIELTEELLSSMKSGNKLYIEKPDGTKEILKILGL